MASLPRTLRPSRIPAPLAHTYTPPAGTYDLPFTWVFDATPLTNGTNALNQQVPVYAGYGDFVMRRIVGLDTVLSSSPPFPGQYQIRDKQGRYLQEIPTYISTQGAPLGGVQDLAIVRELIYPENSAIGFDLYNINKVGFNKIGFQGARRVKGLSPFTPSYKYRPKTYTLISPALTMFEGINPAELPGINPVLLSQITLGRLITPVEDYDFELYQIFIQYTSNARTIAEANPLVCYSLIPGVDGNLITIPIVNPGTPNAPLTVTTTGTPSSGITITVSLATNSLSAVTSTWFQVTQALNTDPIASQYIIAEVSLPGTAIVVPITMTFENGGNTPSAPVCEIMLYDQNRNQCSSDFMPDYWLNAFYAPYNNMGAVVPPLFFKQQAQIEIDFLNAFQITAYAYFVGRRRYPC